MSIVPQGFRMTGLRCGIKTKAGVEDLTLIDCPEGAVAAGVYTQNLVFAAPVEIDRQRTPSERIRVVVANSGNANACTGQRGLEDAHQMCRLAAEACGARPDEVLVMSTGVIGEYLPMDKIRAGIQSAAQQLGTSESDFLAAARGITTTDKSHKIAHRQIEVGGRRVTLAGMAKGAGMIGPRMATLLGVVVTDAALRVKDAEAVLSEAVDESFNCISVEGHMSTNDTVLLLASGKSDPQPLEGSDLAEFRSALKELCIELAKMIPDDGEGASHLISIEVRGCATRDDARRIGQTIAASPLVKCAIAGGGPYWGRILSAAGYAGVPFNPQQISLSINGSTLVSSGEPTDFNADAVSRSMRDNRETHIVLQLAEGDASLTFWTSDLTIEYVTFNADYKT